MPWVTKHSNEQYPDAPREDATGADGYNQYHREYTKKEKAANWWHYHWAYIAIGVVAVGMLGWIVKDTFFRVRPDVKVGYVAKHDLPLDTAEALTAALESFCTDLNGDGNVVVELSQYTVDFDAENTNPDAYNQMAGVTQLSAELAPGGSTYIFIMEDAFGFEEQTQVLQYLDGTVEAEPEQANPANWREMVYRWSDCPVLTGLDLGTYTGQTLLDEQTGNSQDILAGLYIGRRGVWNENQAEDFAGGPELWDALTAGATPMQGVE